VKKSSKNRFENTAILKKNIISRRLPRPEDYSNDPLSPKLVIDDLMRKSSSCDAIMDLFTKVITRSSVFLSRRISPIRSMVNATSSFLKNARDRGEIHHLARQVYPDDPKFLEETYYDATSRPHAICCSI